MASKKPTAAGVKRELETVVRMAADGKDEILQAMAQLSARISTLEERPAVPAPAASAKSRDAFTNQECASIRLRFDAEIACITDNPTATVFIPSVTAARWTRETIGAYITPRITMHRLRASIDAGMIPTLSTHCEIYPHRGQGRRRGVTWNIEASRSGGETIVMRTETESKTGGFSDE